MKKELYGIEFNGNDCLDIILPISKEQYKSKLSELLDQISELEENEFSDHYIDFSNNEIKYFDCTDFRISRIHFQVDMCDINLFKAECKNNNTFKNGITVETLINIIRKGR